MLYNPKRKHVRNGMLSPVEFEKQQKIEPEGVSETRGYSVYQDAWHVMTCDVLPWNALGLRFVCSPRKET